MRKISIAFLSVLLFTGMKAQTFTHNGGPISNNGVPTIFLFNVSGLSSPVLNNSFGITEVCLNITHPDMNEITVKLRSPFGVEIELINSSSLSGSNFVSTCFNSTSGAPFGGSGPYTGTFKPTGYLGRFNIGQAGAGTWTLSVKDYNFNGNGGSLNQATIKFGSSPSPSIMPSSSNLPLVFINTNNQALSTTSIVANLGIVDNVTYRNALYDVRNGYEGKARIHIRGSSSQIFEKKAYKIDLINNDGTERLAAMLGMPAESDWVLTPSYSDKTLMRNALTHHLFRSMAHYSPRTRFVELFINGEYFGVYTFMEKPKKSPDRVRVEKISPQDNAYPFITGGYILQINRTDAESVGWYSQFPGVSSTGAKFFYHYEYPQAEVITPQQKTYIEAVMDTFEIVMNGPTFNDPVKGYRRYIDVNSFIDFMIINEFSKNIDGYKLSSYLFKENVLFGGNIFMGPVWDYDIAWHNANYGDAFNHMYFQYGQEDNQFPIPTWWNRFMQDPSFKDQLYCRWHTFRKNVLSNNSIYAYIDGNASLLSESVARNFQQFPILETYIFPNPAGQIGSSYSAMVSDLKSWVSNRGAWLDQYIPGNCNTVSLDQFAEKAAVFTSFPNPFAHSFVVEYQIQADAHVGIELLDLLGRKILSLPETYVAGGEHQVDLPADNLAAGTYLLKLTVNNNTYYRKIIKSAEQ